MTQSVATPQTAVRIFGTGPMAELVREKDWAATPLGPLEGWADNLCSAVNLMLASPLPTALYWGPTFILLYNDAFHQFPGTRHPLCFGCPGAEVWPEAWHIIGPQLRDAFFEGRPTCHENFLVPLERYGVLEDCYWTYCFSPVRDAGGIRGIFNICQSTTAAVVAERSIRQSEARALRILESIGDAVIVTDAEARITRMNPIAVHMTGWRDDEACGKPLDRVFHIVHETTRKRLESPAAKVKRLGRVVALANHTVLIRPDGGEVHIEDSGAPVRDDDGRLTGIVLVFRDVSEKRAIERSLRESEEQNRFALDTAHFGVFTHDLQTGTATRNLRHAQIYGYSDVTQTWGFEQFIQHVVPAQRDRVAGEFRDILRTGHDWEYETDITRADGVCRTIWVKTRHMRDAQGAIARMTGLVADITERKQAERTLRESEARFRSVAETVPGVLFELEASGVVRFVNRWCEDLTGRSAALLSRDGWADLIHPEEQEAVLAALARGIASVKTFETEFRMRDREGVYHALQTITRPNFDEQGRLTHWTGAAFDVTARKHVEAALHTSEERFRTLFDLAPVGVAVTDAATERILLTNPEMARITGYSQSEMSSLSPRDFTHPEDRGIHDDLARRVAGKAGGTTLIEKRYIRKDGEVIWVRVLPRMTSNPDGEGLRILHVVQNITESRQAQTALIQSEKLAAVGRLAASIAHEINNPLEAVTNLLYLAKSAGGLLETREYLETAEKELHRVAAIASQTLRFHRQSTSPRAVACEDLLESVLAIYSGKIHNTQVDVACRFRATLPIHCFDGEVRQVLSNLVGNAVDAMSDRGRLLLRTRHATNWRDGRFGLVFTVADTGKGMSAQTLHRLFEAFYTTKGNNGTGLGLWISQEIAARHQGFLRVRSRQKEPHQGTIFTFWLPFEAATRDDV